MIDGRHPEDQLFFVAEQDFRFYKEDCVGHFDWIQKLFDLEEADAVELEDVQAHPAFQGTGSAEDAEPFARSSASSEDQNRGRRRDRTEFEKKQEDLPSFRRWQPGTRCRMKEGHVSQELSDLVRIVTTAHRQGFGNLVWLSWCGTYKRRATPSHGSTLLALNRFAAHRLLDKIMDSKPMHFDVWLRDVLIHDNMADSLNIGASYVWPSIGSYDEHLSGCDPKNAGKDGIRSSDWEASWTQAGVRPTARENQDKERWIAKFKKEGAPGWLVKVDFTPRRELCWLTQGPPTKWWSDDYHWQKVLEARGWIWNGQLWTPEVRLFCGRESGAPRPLARYWADVAKYPDVCAWEQDVHAFSPITRLAELIVVDFDDYNPVDPKTTERMKNCRKKQLAIYKRRIFVQREDDVARAFFDPSRKCPPPIASSKAVSSEVPPEPFAWTRLAVPFATEP